MIAGTLEIQLMANIARLQKDMDDAKRAVGGAMSAIESSVNLAKGALAGLAAGLSIAGLTQMLRASIDAADGLNDLSKSTGLTVQQLSGLKLAAQQSGGELEGTAAAINKLSVAMAKDAERFARLGITAKEPLEAFKQLADVFSAIEDPQLRAALGAEALGKSWASAAPLLAEGSKGIDAMVTKGMAMSGVTQEMADRADEFNDMLAELTASTDGLKMKLAGEVLPAMTKVTRAITDAYEESGKLHAAWVAIGALGAFLWTDEFEGTASKIKKVNDQLAIARQQLAAGSLAPQGVGAWFIPNVKLTDEAIAALRSNIKALEDQLSELDGSKAAAAAKASADEQKKASEQSMEAARKAAEFLKQQNDAEAKRNAEAKAAVQAANEELKKQSAVLAELNGVLPSFEEDWARLNTMYRKGTISLNELTAAQADLLAKQPGVIKQVRESEEAHRAEEKALREVADARQKVIDGLTHSADSVGEHLQKLFDESAALDIARAQNLSLAQAIELVAIARLEEKQAWAQSGNDMEAVAIIQREIDLRRQLIQEIGGKEARDAAAKGAQSAVDEWTKAGEKISDTITDALMRGFESGKGLIANLRDTFVNVMQTSLVRPGVQGAVNTGMNVLGLGGGSTSAGMLSGLMGVGSAFGSSMASGFQLAMSGGTGMAMQGGWGMLTAAKGASSAAAGLGQLAGAAAPWVAGALLLSEAAKGLNGGSEYTTGQGITGSFGASGFAGRNYQTWQNDGDKLFGFSVGHSSSGTNYKDMDSAQARAFTKSFESIKVSAAGYATALGASARDIEGYSKSIKIAMTSDAEANAKAIAGVFADIANEVAATVVEAKYIREGETASAALERLATSLTVVNSGFDLVGKSLIRVGQVGANTASQLVERFGGADAYASAMAQFNQNFFTEEERAAKTRATLTKSFADMGMVLPTNIEQYRALVLAQDVSTEAGQKVYATLVGLSSAFAGLGDAMDPAIAAAKAATTAQEAAAASAESAAKALNASVDAMTDAARAVQGTMDAAANAVADLLGTVQSALADTQAARQHIAPRAPMAPSEISGAITGLLPKLPESQAMSAAAAKSVAAQSAYADAVARASAAQASYTTAVWQNTAAHSAKASSLAQSAAADSGYNAAAQSLDAAKAQAAKNLGALMGKLDFTVAPQTMVPGKTKDALWESIIGPQWKAHVDRFGVGWDTWATTNAERAAVRAHMVANYNRVRDARNDLVYDDMRVVEKQDRVTVAAAQSKFDGARGALNDARSALESAQAAALTTQAAVNSSAAAKTAADNAAAAAQAVYAAALKSYTSTAEAYGAAVKAYTQDAAKSVSTLGKLREETLRYYEAQKAIADQMVASSTSLKAAAAKLRDSQLDPQALLQQQLAAFDSAYTLALSTTGSVQAGYADKLTALLPELSTALQGSVGSREEWIAATAALAAKSDSIAKLLDTGAAGMDYQAKSLSLLNQIDTTLAVLGDSTQLITAAINSSGGLTVAGLRQVVTALGGTPSFDVGTNYVPRDMLARIHEGEAIVPKAYNPYNPGARAVGGSGVSGDNRRLEALLEQLLAEIAGSRAEGRATASHTAKAARILERITPNGDSLQTVPAA